MDMSQYRDMFVAEAREHLGTMGDSILALEKDPADADRIGSLFRNVHSIKGMAASMDFPQIAALAHRMEDLMDRIRKGRLSFDAGAADLLLAGADFLGRMVDDVAEGQSREYDTASLVESLLAHEGTGGKTGEGEAVPGGAPAAAPPAVPESSLSREPVHDAGEGQRTVRVRSELLDRLVNVAGELVTSKNRLTELGEELGEERLRDAVGELARLVRELRSEVMAVRLIPFASICDRLPRMVRDLARQCGKSAVLVIEGKELELDRGILELLSDPLVHIIRNAVDHGIEPPEERAARDKGAEGLIVLSVTREKDHVVVAVADDGRGMDPVKLVASAEAKGLLAPGEGARLTPEEAFMLTCLPGFSTAGAVTDVSGRGVGMDAVLTVMRQAGGSLAIQSEAGRGSRMSLRLPLSVAIIPVLIASCSSRTMALPVTAVVRTVELDRRQFRRGSEGTVFDLDGEEIPVMGLGSLLKLPPARFRGIRIPVVVTDAGGRRTGIVVDRLLGQTEIFVRPLGKPLAAIRGLAGGAILGDGQVIFILDLASLLGPVKGSRRTLQTYPGIAKGGAA